MFISALKLLVMPPLCLFVCAAVGLLLWRRAPRTARWMIGLSSALLVLLSIPAIAAALLIGLQNSPPGAELDPADAQAIVVLGADANVFAPEYNKASVGPLTLERLRYAARIGRQSRLPLLVSAGPPRRGAPALALAMASVLEDEFLVPVRWKETRAMDTRQNAQFSAELLRAEGIERVLVVTHAWHGPRALAEFRGAGLSARLAGTGWRESRPGDLRSWVPSARGLRDSSWALHEWIGRAWYALV